jgi:hypothetical protein
MGLLHVDGHGDRPRPHLGGLAEGNHRFQCCIHPWMRAIVKVKPERHHDHDDDHEEDEH